MVRAVDAEVGVPAQVVRQETNADLKRDQLAGKGDEGPLRPIQEPPGRGEITLGELLEHRHLHPDFGKVALILQRRAGRRAHHVAEVIERAAGHDRVEVHHALGFARDRVEHDVVELRIVVSNALGDLLLRHRLKDHIHQRLVFKRELDLRLGRLRAVKMVRSEWPAAGR